jgi:hypothetical protein
MNCLRMIAGTNLRQVDTRVVTTRQAKGNSATQPGVIRTSRSAPPEDLPQLWNASKSLTEAIHCIRQLEGHGIDGSGGQLMRPPPVQKDSYITYIRVST